MKAAFITGVTGQDGSYMSELLLSKGYHVYGLRRRSSGDNTQLICHLTGDENFFLVVGDITDGSRMTEVVQMIADKDYERIEIYNLAAQSHVAVSFSMPVYTTNINAMGTINLLEAIRKANIKNRVRFYQASTSEMFGDVQEIPQTENTPFYPRSPYAVAKLYGHWISKNYREAYGSFNCSGILFNHESPRRGVDFVTRKITLAVNRIAEGTQDWIELGNLDSLRDWGHSKDFVNAMWLMLQADEPDDYVISTGEQHSVREFATIAFSQVGIEVETKGRGINEVWTDRKTGKPVLKINAKFYRPSEVETLLGDCSKAERKLGWKREYSFADLVSEMVACDASK
jgi:GDPmannose 4,6-dehydratase